MIVLQESAAVDNMTKPVLCPKCERGRLGDMPEWSNAVISRRGKPPPDEQGEGLKVKCPVCRKLWILTIE